MGELLGEFPRSFRSSNVFERSAHFGRVDYTVQHFYWKVKPCLPRGPAQTRPLTSRGIDAIFASPFQEGP